MTVIAKARAGRLPNASPVSGRNGTARVLLIVRPTRIGALPLAACLGSVGSSLVTLDDRRGWRSWTAGQGRRLGLV
jgi:hypothetical protein